MTHALALLAFLVTWPLGALLCFAVLSLYLRLTG